MAKILTVGIAGGTGSGKTTLTKRLHSTFPGSTSIICHDWYYRARDGMSYEERSLQNYDCPEAFETERLISDLLHLRAGDTVRCPVYDYTVHNRSKETVEVAPTAVVIVEGILIFADERLRDLFDIKIFVDTDADIRILRRIDRDMGERGRSFESIAAQYLSTVKPMHELYVEPSKKYADVIVPEGGRNTVALEMITDRIARHIRDQK